MDRHPTDAQVQLHVRAQLDWELALDTAHIDVEVHDGYVAFERPCQQLPATMDRRTCGAAGVRRAWRDQRDRGRAARVEGAERCRHRPLGAEHAAVDHDVADRLHPSRRRRRLDHAVGQRALGLSEQAAAAAVRYVVGATGVTDLIIVGAAGRSHASRLGDRPGLELTPCAAGCPDHARRAAHSSTRRADTASAHRRRIGLAIRRITIARHRLEPCGRGW